MSTKASNIAEQGSVNLDSSHTCASTPQTSAAEQVQLANRRIQDYINNTDHSSTHTTQAYTIDQASVTLHYTSTATKNIENFDASFYGNACNGRGR